MIYSVDAIRSILAPIAEKYHLRAVYLFGSYARGTATADSDIDLLVDTTGSSLDTLFKLGALYMELSQAFDKEVDMITVSSLEQPAQRPSDILFRDSVLKERMRIYAVA
ncbi:MAG: nucleotidyltransferase domain-containing protein [Clostridia bacterium]|nr:nucleotidyltransferase domain-containing protein [Clostridia bacterium]